MASGESLGMDRSDFETAVFGREDAIQDQFEDAFGSEVQAVVDGLFSAFAGIKRFTGSLEADLRAAWVEAFLHGALDCVASSTRLLLVGLPIPSGNLMRQFGEACAMALLCSHHDLPDVHRLTKEQSKYPTHSALKRVTKAKTRSLLGLDQDGWEDFKQITKWYDRYSHPSLLTLGSILSFHSPGEYHIGGAFDPSKEEYYRKEFELKASACEVLEHLADHLAPIIQEAQRKGLIKTDFT